MRRGKNKIDMVKIDKFIERNVSVDATPSQQMSSESMDGIARSMSKEKGVHKVIITFEGGDWKEYENGKCESSTVAEWLD